MGGSSISRRGLFGVTAAGALTALGVTSGQALAAGRNDELPRRVDVVVVGAGLSGLVAAREIARAGRSVLVLESRDRVGGRVLNHTLADGSVIESGGAFVGPTQDHILALADELGVRTFKEYVEGENVYYANGRTTRYRGTVPPDPLILPDVALLQLKIDRMSREVPVDAPWTAPKAASWDATSLHDWVAANTLNPATMNLLLC